MFFFPFPDPAGLRMPLIIKSPRIDAIAIIKDIRAKILDQEILLAALLGLYKVTKLDREIT
ncbi:MAG: hypothetical protein II542_06730 [Bacteroidales bacterium]|nr:hypothetical protein [Bacteroidales bacterium]